MKSQYTGWRRIIKAFTYSYDGFVAAFRSEEAFRQDLIIFIMGSVVALCITLPIFAKCVLISALLMILLAELFNTAIETVVDLVSPDFHPLAKKAKDIGSLMVLLSFVNAAIWWVGVLLTYWKL